MLETIKEQWPAILEHLKQEHDISDVSFKTWLLPLEVVSVENNTIIIVVPEESIGLQYIKKKYYLPLKVCVEEVVGEAFEIEFVLPDQLKEKIKMSALNDSKDQMDIYEKAGLNPKYTFSSFVVGENNNLAHAAALAVAESPAEIYNPLYIYGGVGLGKTHLMVSIGNYIYEKNPDAKICYISTESFMNEFTSAIRDKTTQKFTKKYRNLDVFLLDDIQFLEGKEALQNELFYTFNEIYDRKGQLVFTCDRPISEVKGITDRLRSRFAFGQTIDLKLPDYETRRAILEKKMSQANKSIPADVIDFIAKNVQSNVRELEACLKKMIGYADLVGKDITLQIAQEQLRDTISTPVSGTITVETIQKAVAEHFGITVANLKSSKRDKKFAFPRQVAFYIAKQQTECSLKDIGEEFGGRDHTTVLHGIDKIEKLLKYDASLDATLKHLVRDIKEFKN